MVRCRHRCFYCGPGLFLALRCLCLCASHCNCTYHLQAAVLPGTLNPNSDSLVTPNPNSDSNSNPNLALALALTLTLIQNLTLTIIITLSNPCSTLHPDSLATPNPRLRPVFSLAVLASTKTSLNWAAVGLFMVGSACFMVGAIIDLLVLLRVPKSEETRTDFIFDGSVEDGALAEKKHLLENKPLLSQPRGVPGCCA